MSIIETVQELRMMLAPRRLQGLSIGYVPTMGALHEGHLTLVRKCVEENDICVISIFVNPTQFNNKEDLALYPRTLERDCKGLESVSPNIIVFVPSEKEVYPEPDTRQFDFGQLDKVMEGKFRPGHFNGVAQVVSRFFDIIKPDRAYFGEKDFQQLAIIRAMVEQLNLDVNIIAVPIVREPSGLAMSSRNERLTAKQRQTAANIYKVLQHSKEKIGELSVQQVLDEVISSINAIEELTVEYFEIVDGRNLQPVLDWKENNYIVGCIAVFCGEVRLIDNIIYKNI